MQDIKLIIGIEGKITFKKLDRNNTIMYKDNDVKIGVYHANINDIKEYCIANNLNVDFIEEENNENEIINFVNNLTFQINNCMTEEEKETINLSDLFYYEFGIDATEEKIEEIIKLLENNFIIKRKNYPTRYISIF